MAREEKTLTELELQPTTGVDRANDYLWTVDTSDTSMSEYGTSKKVKVEAFIGDKGDAASVDVGTTTTGEAGTNASVVNSGTTSDAILDFTIPRGDKGEKGDKGDAATVNVGTTTTGLPGTSASVVNSGSTSAAILDFTIPRGDKGEQGPQGPQGEPGEPGEDGLDITWRGTYSASTSYVVNDAVYYNGGSYICIQNTTGNLPTNETYWNLMAAQGAPGEGSGDVVGPDGATDNAIARFDLATGKLIQDSLVTINDSGSVNIPTGQNYLVNGVPVSGYSDEQAQDAVGTILTDTTTIDFTYTDLTPEIKADVKSASLTTSHLASGVLDTDLTSVSASDDTLPSAKATKTYVDSTKFTWRGAWATTTAYAVNDTVQQGGSGYVCVTAHTSGTFATDLSAGKWNLFVEGLPTPNLTTSTTTNLTGVITGNGSVLASKTNPSGAFVGTTDIQTLTNKTIDGDNNTLLDINPSSIIGGLDGWIPAGETWTYASATTFTISGDKTGKYQKGDKIKLTQTTAKYFYIIGVSYSSPNTTVTVTGGSDYSLANATITSPYFSKINNPQGFPPFFNWTASITCPGGTAPTYSTNSCSFSISGGFCLFTIYLENSSGGTAGATTNPIFCSKPISASSTKSLSIYGTFSSYEQDVATLSSGVLRGGNAASLFYFMKYNGANLTGEEQSSTTRQLFGQGQFPI